MRVSRGFMGAKFKKKSWLIVISHDSKP